MYKAGIGFSWLGHSERLFSIWWLYLGSVKAGHFLSMWTNAGSCEHGNETSGPIKGVNFLGQILDYSASQEVTLHHWATY